MEAWRGLSRHRPAAIQALRMTTSSLAAFALATALGLPQSFWAVITALIVTQANVGGSLKAAFDRFAGSVCGAIYGGAVAFAVPHDHGLARDAHGSIDEATKEITEIDVGGIPTRSLRDRLLGGPSRVF